MVYVDVIGRIVSQEIDEQSLLPAREIIHHDIVNRYDDTHKIMTVLL